MGPDNKSFSNLYRPQIKKSQLIAALAFVLVIILAIGTVYFWVKQAETMKPQSSQAGRFENQSISLNDFLSTKNLESPDTRLTINGQLGIGGTLIFSPISQPARAVTGQVYFDKDTNSLGYYDGEKFVMLASNEQVAALQAQVQSLDGAVQSVRSAGTTSTTNITNNLVDCSSCVKLQGENSSDQVGNISLAGSIKARKTNLRASVNDPATFSVETSTGERVLTADTLNRNVRVGSLLPNEGSTGTKGSFVAPYEIDNRTYSTIATDTGGAYTDMVRWTAKGSDGFLRFVYVDENTSDVVYNRCTDATCLNKVRQVVASDPVNWTMQPTIALGPNDTVVIGYLTDTAADDVHIVRCSDIDCSTRTDNIVGTTGNGYEIVVGVGPDGLPVATYNDFTQANAVSIQLVKCQTSDCSTSSTVEISDKSSGSLDVAVGSDNLPYVAFYETDEILSILRCSDVSCGASTISNYPVDDSWGYRISVVLGSDGLPRVAFEWNSAMGFLRCTSSLCDSEEPKYIADSEGLTWGYNLALDSMNRPVMTYVSSSPRTVYAYVCSDASCNSGTQYEAASSNDYIEASSAYVMSDGSIGIAYNDYSNNSVISVTGLVPTEVLPVITAPVEIFGTNIGTTTERFGQLFAAGLDLQGYGSSDILAVNYIGGYGASGSIASFRVDGVEKITIDTAGRLNIGDFTSIVQPGAMFNLAAGATGSDLFRAYNTNNEIALRINNDGSIISGIPTDCARCIPSEEVGMVNLEIVDVKTISRQGDYVYITADNSSQPLEGYGLTVIDVRDPLSPKVTSKLEKQRGSTGKFYLRNGFGYFGTTSPVNSIDTFNLSDPARPTLVSSTALNPNQNIYGMASKEDYLYVVGDTGLHIYSIASPGNPVRISFLRLGTKAWGAANVSILGNTAIVNNLHYQESALYSVDISNPAAPVLTNTLPLNADQSWNAVGEGMAIAGTALYLPCSSYVDCPSPSTQGGNPVGFRVVDVSNPNAPSVVRIVSPYENTEPEWLNTSGMSIRIHNGDLYVTDGLTLAIYDITNPLNPVVREKSRFPNNSLGLVLPIGDTLYTTVTLPSKGIRILAKASSSSFQKVDMTSLNVTAAATLNGPLKVEGMSRFTSTATIDSGANLIVSAMTPPAPWVTPFNYIGQIPYVPGATRYYKVTALSTNGESVASTHTYPASSFQKMQDWGGQITAAPGSAGLLTGTFKYKYTYVTSHGESTAVGNNPTVTVSSQQVDIGNIWFSPSASVTSVKIYRCTMPACSSYQHVGTVSPAPDGSYGSYSDNSLSPGAVIPTTNTAYTDTNAFMFSLPPTTGFAPGTTHIRIYRSDDGTNYAYQTFPISGQQHEIFWDYGDPAEVWTPGSPSKVPAGRLGVGTANPRASIDVVGTAVFQSNTDAIDTFQVQNAAGTTIFDVDTVNSRVGVGTATPGATVHVSAAGASGPLFRVTDTTATARDVFEVADTGITTFRNQTDSTSAFRVQNAAGTTIFSINTTNLRVEIASGSDIHLAGIGNAQNAITKTYTCSATEAIGDIVIVTASATVGRTATANSNRVAGVVMSKPTTTTCAIAFSGSVQVNFGANATPAAIGDPVTTSATSGMAQSNAAPPAGASVGISTSAKDGSNRVWVLLRGN